MIQDDIVQRARALAELLNESASTILDLCDALEKAANGLPVPTAIMNQPVSILKLSVRCENILNRLEIRSIGQLANTYASELFECRNCGITAIDDLRKKLSDRGLALKGEIPESNQSCSQTTSCD